MRRLAAFTTLALILAAAAPLAAQDKQDSQNKQDSKGGLGGVLDTLGNVLGTGTQKLHGTVVANEGSTFVLRTDDHRTYRVDAASLDPQKVSALTPGVTVSVTARGGGQAAVLTPTDVTPDPKGGGKAFQAVSGTVQEAGRQRVLFKTRDGLVLPVDVSNINGLPYLAPNQPATAGDRRRLDPAGHGRDERDVDRRLGECALRERVGGAVAGGVGRIRWRVRAEAPDFRRSLGRRGYLRCRSAGASRDRTRRCRDRDGQERRLAGPVRRSVRATQALIAAIRWQVPCCLLRQEG